MIQVNVLIVDDRPENLLAFESTLSGLGSHLEFVTSAEHALRYLLTNEVALILLDVQMPGVNGFELAELIRQREHTQHTPIIFISATSVDKHYVFKGYSLGAVDYLTKPFEPEILKSKVAFFTKLHEQHSEIKQQATWLEEANAALDALNEDLEDRVRRRAAEIEDAHRKLGDEAAMRTRSQTRLALEHTVTRELAASVDLTTAAPAILRAFLSYLGAETGAIWILGDDGKTLDCGQIEISNTSSAIDLFIKSMASRKSVKDSGLPGMVWEKNSPVWLSLSDLDHDFPQRQLAVAAGFNSAIGIPVKMGAEFFGVIELFAAASMNEEPEVHDMFESIGSEIGQFIHRKRVELERENLLTQEMMLRQQAEKASRLKDEFLATVSHELRTPLNSILGWAQLLQRGVLTEEQRDGAMDTIFRNARAQSQLIEDLLDMSRLITGNFPLELAPTDVRSLVDAAIGIVRPQAEAKSIRIAATYGIDGAQITCDAERVQQMVWNLLVNAIKFSPEGGTVELILDTTEKDITIAVRDYGQGIDSQFLPHVFDRFRQGDSSSTRKHRGLGLGLAIVTNLAELHGGNVTVKSEGLGKGAEFTITLPSTENKRSTIVASEAETSYETTMKTFAKDTLKDIRILIVEDDVDAGQMLSFALRSAGAETRTSRSVSEAFDSLSDWIPDALLSDINMPGEDGYSFIERLRSTSEPEISAIPAIALTAMARPEDGDRALSSGFQMHIPKPVDIEELTKCISGLVKITSEH
ncbi:MAG TPA: response regulator [Pyrinomonadaceae bacterium]|nr:response regulator [Pyrinomonadaceae bacterium]